MKGWLKQLMALLTRRDRTRCPGRVDWRGRALAEGSHGAIQQVNGPERPLSATLCLPACDDAARQEELVGHGDQESETKV
jgi:hypothetical protein